MILYVPFLTEELTRGYGDANNTYIKLRGLSPHANYTDRAAAAGRRTNFCG